MRTPALLLIALIPGAWTGETAAAAGRVDFATGTVTVSAADGRERPLTRGAELDNGDTVRTQDGRAQIRFTDGAYVSLQPNTEFGIRDYRYEGRADGSERGFFALAKGAMRTVTGFIGRVNRDRYRVTTPTATIGIRGTGGVIQVLNDGSTLVIGTSGIWSLTNPAGTIEVPAGISGLAPAKPDTPPQQTSQAPSAAPTQPTTAQDIPFAQGEERTSEGSPESLPTVAPVATPPTMLSSGSGYHLGLAFESARTLHLVSDPNVTAVFDAAGQLTSASSGTNTAKLDPKGAQVDFGTDGLLAWGRWTGLVALSCTGCNASETYPTNQGLHYVIGMPTAVLPTSGTATYTLLGATLPTYGSGTVAPGTFSGALSVSFGAQATIAGQFSAAMPDRTYSWSASGVTTSSAFTLSTSNISGCFSACTAKTAGFFAGTSAERAGIVYQIQDFSGNVHGAAAFKKQ